MLPYRWKPHGRQGGPTKGQCNQRRSCELIRCRRLSELDRATEGFGANRPVTPLVGMAVVEDDYESAVDIYLGMEGNKSIEETSKFRKLWRETKDASACLEVIPGHLGYEREMLRHLEGKDGDWLGSFKTLPNSLQLLMVHSLQSLAFNHTISNRISNGLSLVEPELGDIVAPTKGNGRIDVSKMAAVSQNNLERCRRNCRLGRLSVTGPPQ